MKTLKDIFSKANGSTPYSSAVKVLVCGTGNVVQYRNKQGEEKENITVALTDGSMSIKAICYDTTKKDLLKTGSTVMILNYIMKSDQNCIVITNRSKVLKTSPLVGIEDTARKEACDLVFPPPAAVIPVAEVQKSPVKSLISVRGQVISEELERTVRVNSQDTVVRTLKLRDGASTCKISLWRDLAKTNTSVGTHLEFSDVVVQVFNDEKVLSTTIKTKIEKIMAPEVKSQLHIIALERSEDDVYTLTAERGEGDYPEFKIKGDALAAFLNCTESEAEDFMIEKLPILVDIKTKENEVTSIKEV